MKNGLRVLVVDDERLTRVMTVRQLREAGFVADAVTNGYASLESVAAGRWDVVLCDLRMPGMDGLEVLRSLRRDQPEVDVLVMTAYASVETAVAAMQAGAADYLTKPFHFEELELRLRKLGELRGYRREVRDLRARLETGAHSGLVGGCPEIRAVIKRVATFAGHTAPVLVTGETGTGKEVVARALHQAGTRSGGPFVPVACGAIPKTLAESELFGHERGAFTGASARRPGAFERASGGTLLLDDVDDLPLELQASLLRALQEGAFTRVGGTREVHVDVRVITTTKADLASASEEGAFRADLYYRLRGLEIKLPPLRLRGDDVLLLAHHFLRDHAAKHDERVRSLSPRAAKRLQCYQWPGNVRELRHAIESAVVVCDEQVIRIEHLPEFLREGPEPFDERQLCVSLEGRDSICYSEVMDQASETLIMWAMRRAGGRLGRAAELLGLPRTTLQSKLRRRPSGANGSSEEPVPTRK